MNPKNHPGKAIGQWAYAGGADDTSGEAFDADRPSHAETLPGQPQAARPGVPFCGRRLHGHKLGLTAVTEEQPGRQMVRFGANKAETYHGDDRDPRALLIPVLGVPQYSFGCLRVLDVSAYEGHFTFWVHCVHCVISRCRCS